MGKNKPIKFLIHPIFFNKISIKSSTKIHQQRKYFSSQQIINEDTQKKESKNELIAIDDEDDELSDTFQERMSEKIYKAKEYMLKGDVLGLDGYIKKTAELRDKGTNVLHLAAMAGDAEMIKKAITEHNFNPNESDFEGTKPLHWAAFHGNVLSGRALLSLGANPNLTDNDGQTPLNINLKTFNEEFVELLVREFNADINLRDKEGNSYLNILCLSGEFEIACNIVEKYSDLLDFNTVNNNGESPIHHVCSMSDPETVDLFIQKGASLNVFTKEEQSPFHYAILNNNFESAESLLKKYKCDINVCRRDTGEMVVDSLTPLHVCAKNKELEGAKWLLFNGANYDIQTEDGYTCLHVACEEGDVEMVELLLEIGASPIIGTNSGVQPIHIAANNPKGTKCLKLLLDHPKVDPNVFDNSFYSPLHYAASIGSKDNVNLLLDYHSKINIKGDTGITPIYLAISEECEELVDYLISQGSDLNNADEKGNTPLHIAASIGNMNIVVSLIKAGADTFINNSDGLKPDVCADAGGYLDVASHIKMVQTKTVFEQRKNK